MCARPVDLGFCLLSAVTSLCSQFTYSLMSPLMGWRNWFPSLFKLLEKSNLEWQKEDQWLPGENGLEQGARKLLGVEEASYILIVVVYKSVKTCQHVQLKWSISLYVNQTSVTLNLKQTACKLKVGSPKLPTWVHELQNIVQPRHKTRARPYGNSSFPMVAEI